MNKEDVVIGIVIGFAIGAVVVIAIKGVPGTQTYHNLEEWEVVKDGDDRVVGLKVKRTAESG